LTVKVLIAGDGTSAIHTATELTNNGIGTVLVSRREIDRAKAPKEKSQGENTGTLRYSDSEIISCRGCVNNFQITIRSGEKDISENVSGIVIAEEYRRKENFESYGLKPSHSVVSLSEIKNAIENRPNHQSLLKEGLKALFLTGCFQESNPVILNEVMTCALQLQKEYHQEVFILTGNLKVGGEGLERLYRETKEAGVFYAKINQVLPVVEQTDDGNVTVVYQDEILQSLIKISPDMVVVDEELLPSDNLEALAGVFELNQDKAGFLQTDNVHRESVFTNRRGILVAGPSRCISDHKAHLEDAANAALVMLNLTGGKADSVPAGKARIGVVECARCITCFRICPYKAIRLEGRVTVYADACEGCGICVAECPREYIAWTGPGISDDLEKIHISRIAEQPEAFIPVIVAFCCTRSAGRSFRLAAEQFQGSLPEGLKIVEVPCAGGISMGHILRTFMKGADGVILLTCHPGNCHSEVGNQYAKTRAENVKARLSVMGFEKERLHLETIAANMGTEFGRIVTAFQKQLLELGPSVIRKNLKNS
jgi:quinone-modifying oxidoreductase, subunit QmoB